VKNPEYRANEMNYHVFHIIFKLIFGCLLFSIFIFFTSCDDTLKFKYPQPAHKKNLLAFPEKLQGWYQMDEDSSIALITDREIVVLEGLYSGYKNLHSLDMSKGDTVVDLHTDLLRSYKGGYYLNFYNEDVGVWDIVFMKQKKDSLNFYMVDMESVGDELREITNVQEVVDNKGERDFYLCDPTQREWRKLHKGNFFRYPYAATVKIRG